ncbi:PepSY-associated TM helix domain-containing protein (plasmid) [Deinococcus sp. KNUC1210]|uniref:PepSY-associated TM helix domain-containing protein n=1 Tax=Deinococcus sp. KNUC1210 TaxID=2917691 RepID=UPI001EF02F52|nr:PepSY-associated TM helix domain-containing protein [Deinococcus sp. KNUC1210]ULH17273.1 PepSY-associated TM helix domain-containing protein [Deinococcus sp. KNUC1210]
MSSASTPERPAPDSPATKAARRPRTLKNRSYQVARWLHVYTSMISLLIVLFFSVTGVMLNHPEWTFGSTEQRQDVKGTLPQDWKAGNAVDWLKVTAALEKAGLRGTAGDYRADTSGDTLSFRAPGYSADVTIDPSSGSYTASVDSQGWVAALGDLHRGRDAGSAWSVALDLAGYLLILIAVTGLAMLLYLKKLRLSGILTLLGGAVLVGVIMKLALN